MTGEELYNVYVEKMDSVRNCICETWQELENGDRKVWDAVAEQTTIEITDDANDSWEGHRG